MDVGPGLVWDDVYAALEPFGVSALGARVTGIGIGGFLLGGGKLTPLYKSYLRIDKYFNHFRLLLAIK